MAYRDQSGAILKPTQITASHLHDQSEASRSTIFIEPQLATWLVVLFPHSQGENQTQREISLGSYSHKKIKWECESKSDMPEPTGNSLASVCLMQPGRLKAIFSVLEI